MEEKRESYRSTVAVPFQVSHEAFGTITVKSRDLSVGGIFAINDADHSIPEEGSVINVQVLGQVGASSSVIGAEVVRVENGGFGLRFLYTDIEDHTTH